MRLATAVLALTLTTLGLAGNAEATVIASTTFDGRTVVGNTASGLNWTVNGVADPGALTASHGLFDSTADAKNLFAVQRNLLTAPPTNGGPWTVDVALKVGSSAIQLSLVTLDAYIFSNSGNFQTTSRDLDLKIDLLAFASSTPPIATRFANDIYPNNGTITPALPASAPSVTFDLTGNTLAANTNYILRLTASKNSEFGNNAGIDNLVINGSIVPEPTSMTIWGLGLMAVCGYGWRRRRA